MPIIATGKDMHLTGIFMDENLIQKIHFKMMKDLSAVIWTK